MASVTASHFISRTTHAGSTSESKASIIQTDLNKNYSGLTQINQIHKFQLKSNTKTLTNKVRSKAPKAQSNKPACPVVCGMGVVFISAEVAPWSKTGGLGDVLGGLPPALAAMGHRVMTVAPRYDQYKDGWDTNVLVQIQVGERVETVRFFHCYKRGVDRVFVDHPLFLEKVWGKTGSKIYGPDTGTDYQDNQLRYSLLCQAALEAPRVLNLNNNKHYSGPYGEDVVFVANDWHTALVPCYLKALYQSQGIYRNAKVALCIHNIAYQGRFAFADFSQLNLPSEMKGSFDFMDGHIQPVKGRKINWMKAGILESHRVVTVSPYYAKELISDVAKGVELDHILRLTGITGIVNGMDVQEWNPATIDRNIPLIGFIGRLEEQKGSDILAASIPHFIGDNVQIVVLGTLAHMITAGADFMLVPSRFEPCGLIQLHAMRYGTVPIVSCTGGLVDTVKEGYTGFQIGSLSVECKTIVPADVTALATTVKRAIKSSGTPALKEMIQNCMAQDLSWKGPAKLWEKMLSSMEVIGELGVEGEEVAPLSKENVPTP